jgi:hypothetical protein
MPMWSCFIAFVTSKTEMRAFFAYVKYIDNNWQERRSTGTVKWQTKGFPLKVPKEAKAFVDEVLAEFAQVVQDDLLERYKSS